MKQATLGVIGAGRIGRMHTRNLVRSLPEVFVKAVATRTVDEAWADELGIPVCTDDLDLLLEDREIEAVVIAVPSEIHVETICRAAKAGKHIFCEKPIALGPEPIRRAQAAVEASGVQLQVGFNRRFDPEVQRLQEAVGKGEIGELHSLRITNRDPQAPDIGFVRRSGGLFFDFAVHDFDTARFLSGSEIVELHAAGAVLIDPEIGAAGDIDTAVILLRLANGALGVIDNSRQTHYGYDQRFEAFGSKGNLAAQNLRPTTTVSSFSGGVYVDKPYPSFVERYREAFIAELRAFVRCVRTGSPALVGAKDALAAIQAASAAKLSMSENRPVQLAEVADGES